MGVNGKILEIRGQYNTAKVLRYNVEEATLEQITNLCNQEFTKGCKKNNARLPCESAV